MSETGERDLLASCPVCSKPMTRWAKFCPSCKPNLHHCPDCGEARSDSALVCPSCGHNGVYLGCLVPAVLVGLAVVLAIHLVGLVAASVLP